MATKVTKVNPKAKRVEEIFAEAEQEVDEAVIKEAKKSIKELLQQKIKAEKVVANIDRQIEELKVKIAQDLT